MEGMQLWNRCLKLQSFPKKCFKICGLIWVDILPLFWIERIILSFGDDWSGGLIRTNPKFISTLLPLMTTTGIPIIISYMTKLRCLEFGPWVVKVEGEKKSILLSTSGACSLTKMLHDHFYRQLLMLDC